MHSFQQHFVQNDIVLCILIINKNNLFQVLIVIFWEVQTSVEMGVLDFHEKDVYCVKLKVDL